MPDLIGDTLTEIRTNLTAKTKLSFLDDIEGQVEDDEDIKDILVRSTKTERYIAVTFDRRKNDTSFSYQYTDLILVWLDKLSGGTGIKKPSSQLRVIQWRRTRSDLLKVMRYFGKNNSQMNFRRILILPYPAPTVGWRLDPSVYAK